ncbi:MAG TPA: hypothetical protein VK196_02705 [Magnetospirillum sp.]|nr:hypothetical protein [Magnetospirillum sp.]
MTMRTVALTSLIMLASVGAVAQTVPPKELQVPRVFCSQFPAEGQSFMNQLAGGGKWEQVNAKTFVYGVRPHDPVTGRTEEFRFMFVREDNELSCGDVKPCAHMTRASRNGYEMGNYQFQQLCSLLLINAKTASAMQGAAQSASRSNAAPAAPAAPTGETLATVSGTLLVGEGKFLLNGQQFDEDDDGAFMSIADSWPKPGPAKLALVQLTGGTACPALYRVVDVTGKPVATQHVGNCSDQPKLSFDGRRLTLDFPAFRSAAKATFVYQDGQVRQVR